MPENGMKTVGDWQPPHGCRIVYRRLAAGDNLFLISWTKPPIKGLRRTEFFYVHGWSPADCDRQVEEKIEEILHADSVRLLARGKRTQTADADRFNAEQKGLTCCRVTRNLLVDNAPALEQFLTTGEILCPV